MELPALKPLILTYTIDNVPHSCVMKVSENKRPVCIDCDNCKEKTNQVIVCRVCRGFYCKGCFVYSEPGNECGPYLHCKNCSLETSGIEDVE